MPRVSFHELAEREANDSALYYESESPGLGLRFLDEVERCVASITQNPSAGAKIRGEIRRRMLRKFHMESYIR
jgi:plasmid stabilization system protein ParE